MACLPAKAQPGRIYYYICSGCAGESKRIISGFISPGICVCNSDHGYEILTVEEYRTNRLKILLDD